MKAPKAPVIDARRKREFAEELRERARVWMPTWAFDDVEGDFGKALLDIAARFDSEVAERLDQAGEKMRRGFLDWLGVQGEAARPARMPVVFKLADTAQEAVFASPPVRMQVDAGGATVMFETETETGLRLVPGRIDMVVGVDADKDAIYLPPPGLSDLKPLEPLPAQWKLKSFAAAGAVKLQLEPDAGLAKGMIVKAGERHYRIGEADNGIVTIDPPLEADLDVSTVSKVEAFAPFDGVTRNRQEHALYIGDDDLLNIEVAAKIEVVGARVLSSGVKWQYWGKTAAKEETPDWRDLTISDEQLNPGGLMLEKDEGAIELRKIGEINSRWIRAISTNVDAPPALFEADSLRLKINCDADSQCSMPAADVKGVGVEAMANTTPLVIDKPFFPLGRLPRQFDAFYLGSEEAFSKTGARAKLALQISDRSFTRLSAVRQGLFVNTVMAGVAKDRSLHLIFINPGTGVLTNFNGRGPLQPPSPHYLSGEEKGGRIALDMQPAWQLPVWPEDAAAPFPGFLVGTAAGDRVWIWREHPFVPTASGWVDFGVLPATVASQNAAVQGLVYLGGPPEAIVALYDNKMFTSPWSIGTMSPVWAEKPLLDGTQPVSLVSIVPILSDDGAGHLVTSSADGMIGISDQGEMFRVAADGTCAPVSEFATYEFDRALRPVAIKIGTTLSIAGVTVATNTDPQKIVAHDGVSAFEKDLPFENGASVVSSLEGLVIGGFLHIMATVKDDSGIRVSTWAPYEAAPFDEVYNSQLGAAGTIADPGAPLSIAGFAVVPAGRADIFTGQYDTTRRTKRTDTLEHGFITNDTFPHLTLHDRIARFDQTGEPQHREVQGIVAIEDGQVLYELDDAFDDPQDLSRLDVYDISNHFTGNLIGTHLTLDAADNETEAGDYLWVDNDLYEVISVTQVGSDLVAAMDIPNAAGHSPNPATNDYVRGVPKTGRVAPFMTLNTAAGQSGDWDARLLNRVHLVFPDGTPREQNAIAFQTTPGHEPQIIYLTREFETVPGLPPPPPPSVDFVVDAAFNDWVRSAGDTSTNAELSWEYWNGKGWSKLDLTHDNTENLKTNGTICFDVPSDIAESDWAGKTNFWIRARLIEGDYGQEDVKVVTSGNEQTVKRSTDNVKAPQVLGLTALYSICTELLPKFVLARDNETIVDQSDANRTSGAIVEGFVPVGLVLERLSREAASTVAAGQDCQPECGCPGCGSCEEPAKPDPPEEAAEEDDCPQDCGCHNCGNKNGEAAQSDAETSASAAASGAGRSLFIGLDAKVSAGTANILLMVDKEARHLDFAPMGIASLVGGQFKPLVVDDATRALGESGVLVLSFAVAPTLSTLFGKTLIWLRLTPKSAGDGWAPSIKGAYLNAAYASSKETLTRELLGSSNGSPGLTLTLARPPVLRDTLELRVREPLGEEERDELAARGDGSVLSDVKGLEGDWVLWKKVTDTDDEAPGARVYALDETTGEVSFGDGKHGRIPPIGRNNIVAFGYSRTEPGKPGSDAFPANSVKARTTLNLVSPVESVESVIAADQAAGGSQPETDDRVLRYGYARLRHRGRAVTARDLEDLALESSPDIVQARAFPGASAVRLVVVMKGKTPSPSAAQARELHRLLLESAPVSLSAPQALRIEGPGVRKLRIEVTLEVERLEHASTISNWVNAAIARFFDTGLGGIDGDGWPLGLRASEDDIAYVLSDAPLLRGIRSIKCFEGLSGDGELQGPVSPKPDEIVMLDEDPVRIRFETAEVAV